MGKNGDFWGALMVAGWLVTVTGLVMFILSAAGVIGLPRGAGLWMALGAWVCALVGITGDTLDWRQPGFLGAGRPPGKPRAVWVLTEEWVEDGRTVILDPEVYTRFADAKGRLDGMRESFKSLYAEELGSGWVLESHRNSVHVYDPADYAMSHRVARVAKVTPS